MKFLIDGITYHVELCGEGYPLIMFHGFTGSGSNWIPFCATLGKNSKLIMPDIVGHGLTRFPNDIELFDESFIESVAKHFIKIIDELGYEKVDILGYSMGGRLALSIAVLFPNRVRKLILESASPGLLTDEERLERQKSDNDLALFIRENGIEKFVSRWEKIPLFQSQKSLSTEVQALIRKQRLMNDPKGLENSLLSMGTGIQPSYWHRLNEINADVLLIVGELDQKFCLIAEVMQKSLQNGEVYKIKNAGHAIHVEQPEKFGTIVSEFLSSSSSA